MVDRNATGTPDASPLGRRMRLLVKQSEQIDVNVKNIGLALSTCNTVRRTTPDCWPLCVVITVILFTSNSQEFEHPATSKYRLR